MTFQKLGYVIYSPENPYNFSGELSNKIINLIGDSYDNDISVHIDNCEEPEVWLSFSAEDLAYKKLIGELLTQEEYDALVENNADVILFY